MADQVQQAQSQAEAAAQALNRAAEIKANGKNKVWLPNAFGVNPRPFIEARAKMHRDQNKVFDNAIDLIANPEPEYHYGWAKIGAPITVQRAASGQYRYVKPAEVKSDLRAMFSNHKGVSGELVAYGSLVLIAIPPKAWAECYIEPEIEAIARLASEQDQLQEGIYEQSEGRAKVTFEAQQERE